MFDGNGNLQAGFHDWTVEEARKRLVNTFPESRTRERIWSGYVRLCRELVVIIEECEHWLNGSFVTAKVDPGDLDLLVVVDKEKTDALAGEAGEAFDALVNAKTTQGTHLCDSYPLFRLAAGLRGYEEYVIQRAYWRGQFGFDRNERPKGIVRVQWSGRSNPR